MSVVTAQFVEKEKDIMEEQNNISESDKVSALERPDIIGGKDAERWF